MTSNDTVTYKRVHNNKCNISYFKYLISIEKWVTIDFYQNVEFAFKNFLTRFEKIVDVENEAEVQYTKGTDQEFNRYFLESIKQLTDNMKMHPNLYLNFNCLFNIYLAPLTKEDVTSMIKLI